MTSSAQGPNATAAQVGSLIAALIVLTVSACSNPPKPPPPTQTRMPSQPVSTAAAPTASATASQRNTKPTESVEWQTYRNQTFGFSFEYPVAYDLPENKTQCGLWEEADGDGVVVHWGSRSVLNAFPSQGESPTELIAARVGQDASDVETTAFSADGVPGLRATFRFGGLARFGEIYAFEHQGYDYVATFTAGAMCEPRGLSFLEPAAFDHAIQSLSFQP